MLRVASAFKRALRKKNIATAFCFLVNINNSNIVIYRSMVMFAKIKNQHITNTEKPPIA